MLSEILTINFNLEYLKWFPLISCYMDLPIQQTHTLLWRPNPKTNLKWHLPLPRSTSPLYQNHILLTHRYQPPKYATIVFIEIPCINPWDIAQHVEKWSHLRCSMSFIQVWWKSVNWLLCNLADEPTSKTRWRKVEFSEDVVSINKVQHHDKTGVNKLLVYKDSMSWGGGD